MTSSIRAGRSLCCTARDPTRLDGSCTPPLVKLLTNAMIHVWIRPNRCGPFAEVGGFAAGAVKVGEKHACDRIHGSADLASGP